MLRRTKKWSKRGLALALLLVVSFFIADQLSPLPSPYNQDDFATIVVAEDGTPLRAFADANGVWRYPVTLEAVSPLYIEALLTYEDQHFWRHPGINPVAMGRAAWQAITNGRIISGGSTITMQVARIMDPHERNIPGKLKQMFRALQLELYYSKQEILEIYLNTAPFGGTIEGVQAASYAYLGKPVLELSHGDAALLAVLPQAPSRFRPDRNPERAERARNKVLDRLAEFSVWPSLLVDEAKQEYVYARQFEQPMLAPLLARRLKNAQPADSLDAVRTTINLDLQQHLEMELLNRTTVMPAGVSSAVLVVENESMAVQAYLGSADFNNASRLGHVDMVRARRSPGSTLKPFVYGLSIEDGLIHSASLMVDAPQSFYNYRPGNFDTGFAGPVSVQDALQRSLNLPAVDMLDRYGARKFSARLAAAGLDLDLPFRDKPNLTMILGGVATSLEDLVSGYAALARDGIAAAPRYTVDAPMQERRLMDAGAAWITREMLRDQDRPDLPRHSAYVDRARRVAWKTGTSYGYRDAWAIGVVDNYTVGVWVGRPDGTPTPGQYGAKTALPILFSVVDSLPRQTTAPQLPPKTVAEQTICWPLGQAVEHTPDGLCHKQLSAWTLQDMTPATLPDRDAKDWLSNPQTVWVADDTQHRWLPSCQLSVSNDIALTERDIARWPQALKPWLSPQQRQQSHMPKIDERCLQHDMAVVAQTQGVKIRYPADDAELRPLPGSSRLPSVNFKARTDSDWLYWIVNGETIGQGPADQVRQYRFRQTGQHIVTVMDSSGYYDSITVNVAQ